MTKDVKQAQFHALLAWRNGNAVKLSDAELHEIVLRNHADPQPDKIRRMLTAVNRPHAGTIAQTMREAMGGQPSSPAVPAAEPEPATAPAPAPALPGVLVSHEDPDALAAFVDDFAHYDYSTEGSVTPVDLSIMLVKGALAFTWPAYAGGQCVLYRVVASEQGVPYSPDAFDTLLVTTGTRARDGRAPRTAVRYYTVWAYAGDAVETAMWSQPVLVASGAAVTPPQNAAMAAEGEGAVATWDVIPPTRRVEVHRFKAGQIRGAFSPEHQIFTDRTNLGGFIDPDLTAGVMYEYHAVAWAEVTHRDGTVSLQSSPPVNLRFERRGRPRPVQDLECILRTEGETAQFDMLWTPPPAGEVRFFRSEERPPAGIDTEASLEVLDRMRLGERILFPVSEEPDGRASMRHVGWPVGWNRVYITPVTVVGDRIHPAAPETFIRVPPVADPVIHQRVGFQKLAFAWPRRESDGQDAAADIVHVYESARGVSSEEAVTARPVAEVSSDSYERVGGVVFEGASQLRPEGSTLHLVPFVYSKGRRIAGPATRVDYPGLVQIHYELDKGFALPFATTRKVNVRFASSVDLNSPPRFRLIHHPDRLPLDLEDGEALPLIPKDDPSAVPTNQVLPSPLRAGTPSPWYVASAPKVGYVRLFCVVTWDKVPMVAVLDPTVSTLDVS